MTDLELSPDRLSLLDQFRLLADSSVSLEELQRGIVQAAADNLPHFNWTGFYMLDPADAEMLVLGPFVGDPTPHVRIPVSQGICGAAVASGETVVVDDVAADPRYLSCSIDTKSEIVVPIRANGRVVGEIDIDSHDRAAFRDDDRVFLEEVARIVARYIERHAADSPGPQSGPAPNP
jgi:L-methionine (R)-S-oxide reductase